ncbi:hypothetical protein GCM10009557_52230 [Virgisporangium ochraceum]|uniref:Uncharacterized protein n=1 Tax=Virgisporangium ochraceum TaxID=65505 RepID=A0A8J4A3W1_9ACTN|nr:hypothetical protein Voc01_101460 [Virgisporangium ochraceum]
MLLPPDHTDRLHLVDDSADRMTKQHPDPPLRVLVDPAFPHARWQDPGMHRDACESPVARWDLPPSRWCRGTWVCTGCRAVTQIGTVAYEVCSDRAAISPGRVG